MTICCVRTPLPAKKKKKNHAKHTHQQSYRTVCINNGVTIWRRRAILQDRHRRMLSAAIWQVKRKLSNRTSPPSHFSSPLFVTTSLCHLSLSLCLVLSLLVLLTSTIFFFPFPPPLTLPSTSCISPLLHLYLPIHPPPSRPGSHTETRGSMKFKRGMKERKEKGGKEESSTDGAAAAAALCSLTFSFLPPITVFFFLHPCLLPSLLLSECTHSYAKTHQCMHTHETSGSVNAHTCAVHAHTCKK